MHNQQQDHVFIERGSSNRVPALLAGLFVNAVFEHDEIRIVKHLGSCFEIQAPMIFLICRSFCSSHANRTVIRIV